MPIRINLPREVKGDKLIGIVVDSMNALEYHNEFGRREYIAAPKNDGDFVRVIGMVIPDLDWLKGMAFPVSGIPKQRKMLTAYEERVFSAIIDPNGTYSYVDISVGESDRHGAPKSYEPSKKPWELDDLAKGILSRLNQ